MHYNFKFYLTYNNDSHNNQKKKKTIFLFYLSTSYNIRYISHLYFTHLFIYIYIYIYIF